MFKTILKTLAITFTFALAPVMALANDYFIDVRTPQEYAEDHIDGHLNIIHTEIIKGVKQNNITPQDHIFVYCRSGKRAAMATSSLNEAGYNNVTNLGGINDARAFLNISK